MNKRELAYAVAAKLADKGIPGDLVELVVQATMDHMTAELARTGRLEYRDLGVFTVEHYKARKLHNPKTGATIDLPARKGVSFKPGRRLMKQVAPEQAEGPEAVLAPPPLASDATWPGPWVTLWPSPFQHAGGRAPLRPACLGMAKGRLTKVTKGIYGQKGLVEIDGHPYKFRDVRQMKARAATPLRSLQGQEVSFFFYPNFDVGELAKRGPAAMPKLKIIKLVPAVPTSGLVEVIGTVMLVGDGYVTLAIPRTKGSWTFFATVHDQVPVEVGDLVQLFGRLAEGAIRLERWQRLVVEHE